MRDWLSPPLALGLGQIDTYRLKYQRIHPLSEDTPLIPLHQSPPSNPPGPAHPYLLSLPI